MAHPAQRKKTNYGANLQMIMSYFIFEFERDSI